MRTGYLLEVFTPGVRLVNHSILCVAVTSELHMLTHRYCGWFVPLRLYPRRRQRCAQYTQLLPLSLPSARQLMCSSMRLSGILHLWHRVVTVIRRRHWPILALRVWVTVLIQRCACLPAAPSPNKEDKERYKYTGNWYTNTIASMARPEVGAEA